MSCFLGRRFAVVCVAFSASIFTTTLLPAATITWDGGGGDNLWHTSGNWSGDAVPGAGDDVVFDGTSSKDCVVASTVTVRSLSIGESYSGTLAFQVASLRAVDFVQRGGHVDWGDVVGQGTLISGAFLKSGGTADASRATFTFLGIPGQSSASVFRVEDAVFRVGRFIVRPELQSRLTLRLEGQFSVATAFSSGPRTDPIIVIASGKDAVVALDGEMAIEPGASFEVQGATVFNGFSQFVVMPGGVLDLSSIILPGADGGITGQLFELGDGVIHSPASGLEILDPDGLQASLLSSDGNYSIAIFDWDENRDGRSRFRPSDRRPLDRALLAVHNLTNGDAVFVSLAETNSASARFSAPFPPMTLGEKVDQHDDTLQLDDGPNEIEVAYADRDDPDDSIVFLATINPAVGSGALAR